MRHMRATILALVTLLGCTGAPAELVFESIRVVDEGGAVVSDQRQGVLTRDEWQRAARPWTQREQPNLYSEQIWERPLGDGRTEHGYRILRAPNPREPEPRPARQGPEVGGGVLERAARGGKVEVLLTLADYPAWDVPLRPSTFLDENERAAARVDRVAALAARRALFAARLGALRPHLGGAEMVGQSWRGGWIMARVPAAALRELSRSPDLARIDVVTGHPEEAAWALGEARRSTRIDANRFRAEGLEGDGIVIAINEIQAFEDEGCYLREGPSCESPSRVLKKFACHGPAGARCQPIADFDDIDEPGTTAQPLQCCNVDTDCGNPDWTCTLTGALIAAGCPASGRACECANEDRCSRHATGVSSIIAGDYTRGQADDAGVGDDACVDPCGTGCGHSDAIESRATGLAPRAHLILFGAHSLADGLAEDDALAKSFDGAADEGADIMNNSWVWRDPDDANDPNDVFTDCNPIAILALEKAAEDAFDDGVFVVGAAGNTPETTGCDISAPAVLPKVFAVNGLRTGPAACNASYASCTVSGDPFSSGGAPLTTPDDVTHAGAQSAIALAVPTALEFTTVEIGEHGEIDDSPTIYTFGGSSGAAAVTSGLAALVKQHHLAHGDGWIDDPGKLFTVLLAMGDRHFSAAGQLTTGANVDWGMGKVKMRRFELGGAAGPSSLSSFTATTPDPLVVFPFEPLAPGTRLVKCVLNQIEDMSSKTKVSDVDLTVEIRAPSGAACADADPLVATRSDLSYDVKSMVAFSGTTPDLGGKCARVVVLPKQLAEASVTLQLFCVASKISDDNQLDDADVDGIAAVDEPTFGTSVSLRDSDGDGVDDGTEAFERASDPTVADSDGDGVPDGTDAVTFAPPTAMAAPRLVAPVSTSMVTSRRPALRWELPAGASGALVQLCADRACRTVLQTLVAIGDHATPSADLPAGPVFWRASATTTLGAGCAFSPTWELFVGHASAAVVTSWGAVLDVNGDGYADLAAGAPASGSVQVHLGGAGGLSAATLLVGPDGDGGEFGVAVASAGDVDGDGYGDLLVGARCAPYDAVTATCGAGRAYLYRGGPDGVAPSPSWSAAGSVAGGGLGGTVAGLGDVDGDGYGDVAVGAPGSQNRTLVFRGGAAGLEASPAIALAPPNAGTSFGSALAAGDFDGDGHADLAVGQPQVSSADGAVYLWLGSSAGLGAAPTQSLTGPAGGKGKHGSALAAGDLDGDGRTDLVIGAPKLAQYAGAAYVHLGRATGVQASPSSTFSGAAKGDKLGHALAADGDVDGDGTCDLLLGAPHAGPTAAGVATLHLGSSSGPATSPSATLSGSLAGGGFGAALAAGGDLDGDHHADLVVGAPESGRAEVYFGPAAAPVTLAAGPSFGSCVATSSASRSQL